MPVETIKCKECGSADVTEFKPGSYVCGHCEAVFKHLVPAGTLDFCQVCEGGAIASVGRCANCNRSGCIHHLVSYAYLRDWHSFPGEVVGMFATASTEVRITGLVESPMGTLARHLADGTDLADQNEVNTFLSGWAEKTNLCTQCRWAAGVSALKDSRDAKDKEKQEALRACSDASGPDLLSALAKGAQLLDEEHLWNGFVHLAREGILPSAGHRARIRVRKALGLRYRFEVLESSEKLWVASWSNGVAFNLEGNAWSASTHLDHAPLFSKSKTGDLLVMIREGESPRLQTTTAFSEIYGATLLTSSYRSFDRAAVVREIVQKADVIK